MTVILLRHGLSTSNVAKTLAGRTPGVELTEHGQEQARLVADRLAAAPLRAIVASPMLRCAQTVAPLAAKLGLEPLVDDRLAEVDYGTWTGRPIAELLKEPLWRVVQRTASAAEFPDGERLAAVQFRAVEAIRAHDRRLAAEHGGDVAWLACTHGDVIKSVLADALAVHLDGFQRIMVEPASLSVVRYTPSPSVQRINDTVSADWIAGLLPTNRADDAPAPGGEVSTPVSRDNGSEGDNTST